MPVEFYQLSTTDGVDYELFGVLEDGAITKDVGGALEGLMADLSDEDIDWTDAWMLIRRFAGPTVVANATGRDAEAILSDHPGYDAPDKPARKAKPINQGVTYEEVGGDRTWKARAIQMGAKAGRFIVREAPNKDADLIITIKDTGETVKVRITEGDRQPSAQKP